jgi:hypothetical protein
MKKIILLIILLNLIPLNSFAKELYKPSFEFESRAFLPPDICMSIGGYELTPPNCFSGEGLHN